MKSKFLGLLLTATMIMSLLVGCGENANEGTDKGNDAVVNQESGSSEKEDDNTVEEQADDNNTTGENNSYVLYTLSLCCDEELKQSAVVSYDPEKVGLIDLSENAAKFRWLDRKDVELLLMCEDDNSSVEDVYQKEMKSMDDDDFSVSELTEKKVGNCTVFRSDGVFDASGTVGFEFFAMQLENGMVLYAVYAPGFENQVYLDEMLPYVLANVTTGDGAWMTPPFLELTDEDEDTSSGMEWDTFFEVTSIGGVKVKVYYDPNVVVSYYSFDPEFYLTDAEGNEYMFAIADFDSAEARRKGREDYFNSQKMLEDVYVSELEELHAGEYTIKYYRADYMVYSYDGSGELNQASFSENVIELGSGVVCVFDGEYLYEYPEFGQFLLGTKFVVE